MLAIVLGRLTPGLRMATVIGCGVFGVPFWRFLPSMAAGGFAYILVYTLLGYFAGPVVLRLVENIHLPLGILGSVVPLLVLVVLDCESATWSASAADHRGRGGRPAQSLA